MDEWLAQQMVKQHAPTFGGERRCDVLGGDVFSAEKTGIDGPCTGSDHRDGGGECGERDRHPRVARRCERDPQFADRDHTSCDWSPQPGQEKYPGARGNDLWDYRWRKGSAYQFDDSAANQQDGGENTLKQ